MKQNQQSRQEDELAQGKIERQQMERQHEEERKLRQQEQKLLEQQQEKERKKGERGNRNWMSVRNGTGS